MFENYKNYICIATLGFILGLGVGFYAWHYKNLTIPPLRESDAILGEQIQYKNTTEIAYVPKIKDELTDVQIKQDQPKVNVTVNEKPYQFSLNQGETQKFEKGKLVVSQSGEIKINIDSKQDVRKWTLKLGKSNNGMAGGLDYQLGHVIGAWSYFDSKTYAGGISSKF